MRPEHTNRDVSLSELWRRSAGSPASCRPGDLTGRFGLRLPVRPVGDRAYNRIACGPGDPTRRSAMRSPVRPVSDRAYNRISSGDGGRSRATRFQTFQRWFVLPGKIVSLALACSFTAAAHASEEFLDRIAESLEFGSAGGGVRAQISGAIDIEAYRLQAPAPGLIYTAGENLLNPRLTLFLDSQIRERVYVFAQARVDRGFDPSDGNARGRLDEFAVRVAPWGGVKFNIQAGKFATVVGSWVPRHDSWENPFITAPVPYEQLTGIWDTVAAKSSAVLLDWAHVDEPYTAEEEYADKHLRVPIIWGPAYSTGFAILAETGRFSGAVEVKNAALSAHPAAWNPGRSAFEHPTISARVTYQPNVMWRIGASASTGTYLRPSAEATLPPGHGLGDYREVLFGQEVGFAWHHWQVWLEAFESRFEVPLVGNAKTFSGYAEVKYRFTPLFSGAVRWNTQSPGTISIAGGRTTWGRDVQRLDIAPAWRFSANSQLKLQLSLQHEPGAPRENSRLLAAQFTVRF